MQFYNTWLAFWYHFVAMNADLFVSFQSAEHGYYSLVECDIV